MLLEESMQGDQEVVRIFEQKPLEAVSGRSTLNPKTIQSFVVRLPCSRAEQLSRAII